MLPAVLRRGAGLPLARGAAGAATWHKPQVGLELPQRGDVRRGVRLRTVTTTEEAWLSLRPTQRYLGIKASGGGEHTLAERCDKRVR